MATVGLLPPDTSLMVAPEPAAWRVNRSKLWMTTFSLHVPETTIVLGPAGLRWLSAALIPEALAPQCTCTVAPCAIVPSNVKQISASKKRTNRCVRIGGSLRGRDLL